jgi:hypothetical protein
MSKRAVLIGINYKSSEEELKGCINDIQHIKFFLLNTMNYKTENITILTDDSFIKPTRKNIEEQLLKIVKDSKTGDSICIQYSGHGSTIIDRSGDEIDGKDEVLCPIDFRRSGVISDDWLYENIITKILPNVNTTIIIDACHSQSICDLKYNLLSNSVCSAKNPQKYVSREWSNQFSLSIQNGVELKNDISMLSGCLDVQTSADAFLDGKFQGAFTSCLLDMIKENIINGSFNKNLKLREVCKQVNARLQMKGFSQKSVLSVSKPNLMESNILF